MTSTSRREEYSSNIIRTLHPTATVKTSSRTASSNNLNENIDYLLDDLQHSVTGTSQYLASKNVQHLSPSNTTTYIREERSISPSGRPDFQNENRSYKTSSYQYKTSTGGATTGTLQSSQQVNQLDTLLQDLKKERELSTREKDYSLTSYSSELDSGRLETRSPILGGGKRIIEEKVTIQSGSPQTIPKWSTSAKPATHYEKHIETKTTRDVAFDGSQITSTTDIRQTPTLSRTEKYIESRTLPYQESRHVTTREDLPEDLKNVPLSDDILPVPGTKVTTTVRTYTYEIPGEPQTTKKVLYKRELNTNETYPERELPPTVTYKTESYRTTSDGISDLPPPAIKKSTLVRRHDESSYVTDRNGYIPESPPTHEKIVHEYRTVTSDRDIVDSPRQTSTPIPSPPGPAPVTYYYKHHESTNTKNTLYGPPGGDQYPPVTVHPPYPTEPATKTSYYYSSKQTTSKTGEREPLLQPAPFPTENGDLIRPQMTGPPKRVDDLMASLGNESLSTTEIDHHVSRKEVDTSTALAERPPPSKNMAGPPVYYPPGREVTMKKEEMGAAYRAGGGYAKARAEYEYEAESKSKSKTKKGGAIVPVCLPLCCAMPCVIM